MTTLKPFHTTRRRSSGVMKFLPKSPAKPQRRLVFLTGLLMALIYITGYRPAFYNHGVAPQVLLPRDEIVDYQRTKMKVINTEVIDYLYEHTNKDEVNWDKLAYVLYATSETHVCNAMMMFNRLRRFKTRAKLVLLAGDGLEFSDTIQKFIEQNDITIKRTPVIQLDDTKGTYWMSSYTKLSVFGLKEYDRIIYLDSDATLTQSHLDELFFIPPVHFACVPWYWEMLDFHFHDTWLYSLMVMREDGNWELPRPKTTSERKKWGEETVYNVSQYIDPKTGYLPVHPTKDRSTMTTEERILEKNTYNAIYDSLSDFLYIRQFVIMSVLMVISPNDELSQRVAEAFDKRDPGKYDMDMINKYLFHFRDVMQRQMEHKEKNGVTLEEIPEFMTLPQSRYAMLTDQLNMERHHLGFLADPVDIPYVGKSEWRITETKEKAYYDFSDYKEESTQWFPKVKYAHFSDSPIPKPWIKRDPNAFYMAKRRLCKAAVAKDPTISYWDVLTEDCKAGEYWNDLYDTFARERKQVCGLDLVEVQGDAYKNDIH